MENRTASGFHLFPQLLYCKRLSKKKPCRKTLLGADKDASGGVLKTSDLTNRSELVTLASH